ncbi:hypothetical protein Bca4012_037029 [Brassica carinata]|uniref:Uncharacterized protein n=1 Tax=Brassica carinata TaxID=52824 RepID=A0A8X7WEU2_BRACI|nr:hypothetical protein Bca52824_010720 [Brassica carinata]
MGYVATQLKDKNFAADIKVASDSSVSNTLDWQHQLCKNRRPNHSSSAANSARPITPVNPPVSAGARPSNFAPLGVHGLHKPGMRFCSRGIYTVFPDPSEMASYKQRWHMNVSEKVEDSKVEHRGDGPSFSPVRQRRQWKRKIVLVMAFVAKRRRRIWWS